MIRPAVMAIVVGVCAGGCAQGREAGSKRATQAGGTSTASVVSSRPATTPASIGEWEEFDFASAVIPPAALEPLPLVELQRVRGIIFGRHGRIFQDSTLQSWLASRSWYHADTAFTNARLSRRERDNLDVVRKAEAKKHTQIEPGDMRFYENRVITTTMLGEHPPQDWESLEAEVLANHGYVFESDLDGDDRNLRPEDLQRYFDERYWYRRDPEFSAAGLSAVERQNLDTIALAVMRQNKRVVTPGRMDLFQSTSLTEQMLANLPLADLRLLRNEIYARHGRRFQTAWLAEYFRQEPWYTPREDYSDAQLSAAERANIALISTIEERRHQALSTTLLSSEDVRGLRPDDARRLRNEIYARHGRRFRDPKLQRYFASFSWYKPNDSFRESELSETEKRNAELISQYEHGRFTEG